MLLQLAPFAALKAWAAEGETTDLESQEGDAPVAWGSQEATESEPSYYIANDEVTINGRVTVTGYVVLILADGCYLQIPQGITVGEGNTLVIRGQDMGTGQLIAGGAQTMEEGAAGIGGYATLAEKYENQQDGAQHNTPSATYEDKETVAGTIVIDGGMVTAQGGASGAGIGSGAFDEANRTGAVSCKVEINGGTVNAYGGKNGAGIGGGQYANGGTITIRGKDTQVNASGYTGIGGGNGGAAGTITIEEGTVMATGQSANGIGTGDENDESPEDSHVTIQGGKVTALSNYFGAGIKANTVTIEEGKVIATGTNTQTGIDGTTIAISGGTVEAISNSTGAGINGSGTVEISGGTVTAKGGAADAGINSASGTIKISGGSVAATGGATGTGINSDSGTVEISGGTVTATGSGAGIGGTGGTAMVCGGNVTATGSSAGIGTGTFTTTAEDGTGGNAFIVASSISDNADTANWSGVIFQEKQGEVYGGTEASPLTLTQSATVPKGATLHVASNAALRLDKDVQLIVDDANALTIDGTIVLGTGAYVGNTSGAQIVDEDGIVYEESDMLSGSAGAGTKTESNSGAGTGAGTGTGAEGENGGGALVALLLGGGIAAGTAVYFYVRAQRAAAKAKEAETAAQAPEAAPEASQKAAPATTQEAAQADEMPAETAEAEIETQAADATA
jgi:hypothetical protein